MNSYPSRLSLLTILMITTPCFAAQNKNELVSPSAHVDAYVKRGNDRTIGGTEFWLPLTWNGKTLSFADFRFQRDNMDGSEGNFGLGLRWVPDSHDRIFGVYGFFDRRETANGSFFSQATIGAEALTKNWDARINGYQALSDERVLSIASTGGAVTSLQVSGSNIVATGVGGTAGLKEVPTSGGDFEIGRKIPLPDVVPLGDTRFYAGAYHFDGDDVDAMNGYRLRARTQVSDWLELGLEHQRDNIRGETNFAEIRFRIPLSPRKKSYQRHDGIFARLDERVVRDIDIVTQTAITGSNTGQSFQETVINRNSGAAQTIIFVDNTAAPGGDGTQDHPYNTLTAASAAAGTDAIIYVRRGDGTSAGMDNGIIISDQGQWLYGSGIDFRYDPSFMDLSPSVSAAVDTNAILIAHDAGPVLSNSNLNGDAVSVTANDVRISGLTVDGAQRHGINAQNVQNLTISNVVASNNAEDGIRIESSGATNSGGHVISGTAAQNNNNGIWLYARNTSSLSAAIDTSLVTANTQNGLVVYDDSSAGAVVVDAGGGSQSSVGQNALFGNGLEDVSLDLDGGTLSAQNNWWGQAGGPQSSQVYFGAPLNRSLQGHWMLDESSGAVASDRAGGHNGTLMNAAAWDPADGEIAGSIDLELGSSDYVTVPDFAESDNGDKLTVSYWIRPETLPGGSTHVAKWDFNNTNSSWGVRADVGDPSELIVFIGGLMEGGNNYFYSNDADLVTGAWAHLSFVYDGAAGPMNADRLKIYKNGVLLNGSYFGAIPVALNNTPEPVTFGRPIVNNPPFGEFMDGNMDDIRIYNRALSAVEIQEMLRMDSSSVLDDTGSLASAP